MAPLASLLDANNRTLKRPFTADTTSLPFPDSTTGSNYENKLARHSRLRVDGVSNRAVSSRTPDSFYKKMPSEAGPRMHENHIPSFMSVYDMNATLLESPSQFSSNHVGSTYTYQNLQPQIQRPLLSGSQQDNERVNTLVHHQHHESTSTTSDSTDSSPTTTISTIDSSSLSDPSPSSSPESPITLVPLSSFAGSTFGLDSYQALKMNDNNLIRPPISDERPMTSPSPRKFKNPKSLALNLNPVSDALQSEGPPSPSFIKPPPLKARKKPSLLSLNTGAANRLALSVEPLGSPSVPSMLQRRGLKHSISSPQILATPGFGPAGGMTLGDRKPLGPSRFKDLSLSTDTFTISEDSHDAPAGVQMATRVPGVSVGGDSFDRPHTGEDAKSPSYPEGPILMHEPSVHLYSEPKVEEAMKFDVILNVAREVKNPFTAFGEGQEPSETTKSMSEPVSSVDSVPSTAMSFLSFKSAFEVQPSSSTESSPTTPKPSIESKRPEYIHIPWDHNTDVKDELWDLCQLIESRTKEGKKVLVHCQQGASRSATLIIAYGMYINQDMSATEAYASAQSKSRWVNPNMSLLFSLNDFKKIIDKKKAEANNTPSIRKPPTKHRPTLSAVALDSLATTSRARGNSTPSTAARDKALSRVDDSPIPTQSAIERLGSFDFGFDQMTISSPQTQRESKENFTPAPVAMLPPPPPHRRAPSPPKSNLDQQIQPAIQEPRAIVEEARVAVSNEWEDLMSPRLTEMTRNPLHSLSRSFGSTEEEEPATPGLFSPRAFEFPRSAFFPPPVAQITPPTTEDPRSPPTKGEAPITRSIDDVL